VRGDCIQVLLATINQDAVHQTLQAQQVAYGDVFEALLRLGHNFPDAGAYIHHNVATGNYVRLVNCAFPRLVASLQSMGPTSNPLEVAHVLYLLARGLRGIQNLPIRDAFLAQEWPLVATIVALHGGHPKVREHAVDLFVAVVPSTANPDTLVAMARLCLHWHDQHAAPHALSCLGVLAASHPALHPQVLDFLVVAFRSFCVKFNYVPNGSSSSRVALLQRFQHPPEDLALEATQFFLLLREVLRSAPALLLGHTTSSQLLVEVLQFCCDVVAVDHKLPDVTDAVCTFFSDVLALEYDSGGGGLLQRMAVAWVQSLLVFVAMSTISTKTRCVSNVFHQALHAGPVDSTLRGLVFFESFLMWLSADAQVLAQSMLQLKDRRKFQVFLNTTSMYLQGYGPPPWMATSPVLSPRGATIPSFLDVLH
ncbi:hypothetical protein DYB37_012262, partial [Aphanomyces astaci]